MTDQSTNSPQNVSSLKDQVALLSFVEDLIKARNDQTVTENDLPRLRELLLGEVNEAINKHLVNLLSEKAQIELDKLLDTNPSDEQLNQFFIKNIANLEVEIASALLNFRAAYLYPVKEQIAKAVQHLSSLAKDTPADQKAAPSSETKEQEKTDQTQTLSPDALNTLKDIQIPSIPTVPPDPYKVDPLQKKNWN